MGRNTRKGFREAPKRFRWVSTSLRYPLQVVVWGPVRPRGLDDRSVSCWLRRNGLLHKSEKQLSATARFAPVEPEGELVQVVIQMLDAHRSLMRTQQPAL